jgi:hypothetical protein
MQMISARVNRILEAEAAIERLSEKVQGMMLMGQDREDVKLMAMTLARRAKVLAEMCGEPSPFGREA